MEGKTDSIVIKNLVLPYTNKVINLNLRRGLNYLKNNNGTRKILLLDYIAGIRKDVKSNILGNESIIYINQSIFFHTEIIYTKIIKYKGVYRI
ncbi:MAG: hypothetical protein IAC13_10135 [Firmicutes bacterium]|uniref:Uncharacterized protein n=1 Tax=Candidatus Scybalomonas excrementavium TaxID=2840943 RepID=A0A9D9I290_9FIRM|nr:hypothetical protein [Candidatus Scybalomonas excrementavium]